MPPSSIRRVARERARRRSPCGSERWAACGVPTPPTTWWRPPPIVPSGPPAKERKRLAVAYVPDPKAKGLSLLCEAWARAATDDARLAVFGIGPEPARRHLARFGPREPAGVDWRGQAPATEF